MANFKTALEALAKGKLQIESLSHQLEKMLVDSPHFANRMLADLDDYYEQKKIGDEDYTQLKRLINDFRRQHATETENEASSADGDATVFATENVTQTQSTENTVASEQEDITLKSEETIALDQTNTSEPQTVTSDEATVVNTTTQTSSDEATVVSTTQTPSDEATVMMNADSTTSATTNSDSDFFDVTASDDDTSGSATGATDTDWTDPNYPKGDLTGGYKEGSVIKQRFKLEKVLGVGGMGKVYKALDLLKAEARDKKPHVAVKLLNEDFKDHPEAFISLQRESSRQQKLAHPNIATIYDFDRVGGPGTPVFITMELMEGMELKDYIKKKVRPKGGIPFSEAFEFIKQLGAGLIYAHERNLVHSDFKPGNAFLCNDGTVKTLDFGIARAVKNPMSGEAEKTLFDPGKLGALTPAYASLEMLEGEDPDTRDDIYALGCTAYELLTGKHPYNKMPADKAMELNLVPPYIKSLNKKQNRALRRSVAFKREDRSQNVEDFLEELEGKATWHKNPFFIAAVTLLVLGLMLFTPVMNYLHQKELDDMVSEINKGDDAVILSKLNEIRLLDDADRSEVTNDARDAIQAYFNKKIIALTDISGDGYDFPAAERVLDEIREFYQGSIYLQQQIESVSKSKKQIISQLNTQYVQALKDASLIDNTKSILNQLAKIDPQHPLLEDPRPSNAYRLLALDRFQQEDFEEALALVRSGMETEGGKDDPRLSDLENQILKAQKIAQLETDLGNVTAQLDTLSDYKPYQEKIVDLANLKPNSDALARLSNDFKPLIDTRIETVLTKEDRASAESLADEFGDLLNGLQLNQRLIKIKLAHLEGEDRKVKITQLADESLESIRTALSAPQVDNAAWEASLYRDLQELNSLTAEDESIETEFNQLSETISDIYIAKANETLKEGRFDAADNYIDLGERFAPGYQELADVRDAIAQERAEAERLARVDANKADLATFTAADNISEAEKVYDQLRNDLPEDDTYLKYEAAQLLSDSYARLAQRKAESKDYSAAAAFVKKGLTIDPNNTSLLELNNVYEAEANIRELTQLFKNSFTFPADIRLKINQIELADPARYASFSNESANILAKRIDNLRETNENKAAALADVAIRLFPANAQLANLKNELQLKPWDQRTQANAALSAGKLSLAMEIQQSSAEAYSAHPDYVAFSQVLENKVKEANNIYGIYLEDVEAAAGDINKLKQAKNILNRAQDVWTDNPEFEAAGKSLSTEIARLSPSKIRKRETFDLAAVNTNNTPSTSTDSAGETAQAQLEKWSPIASDSECTTRLAGYGTRAKAICYDFIHQQARGPLMVVIPSGEGFQNSYAISKYEISVSDYSKYCVLSGNCKPIVDKERRNDPMTGISLQQAQEYASWLSERTGKTYRLPTREEWQYAANANGNQPKKDVNCRLSIGEKLIKGTGIVSVNSGKSNGWGLKNYVGNVQEWVLDGSTSYARGGAYTDNYSQCDISLERQHSGNADNTTGFRLIREDVG